LGALVVFLLTGASAVMAQIDPTPTTEPPAPTPTTAPATSTTTTPTTAKPATTTTTTRGAAGTTTSTTKPKSTAPVPPPASGPSQTLVPDLLGAPVEITTTTVLANLTPASVTTTTVSTTASATTISTTKNSPSGMTLILATVAWLASVGGLLVYAEDRRSMQWKHLAR
jgi:hypothetical protein